MHHRPRSNILQIRPEPGEQRALRYDESFGLRVMVLANEGKFPEEWCADIGVTMSTLYNWANNYPEFEDSVIKAWHILNAWWTAKMRETLLNPDLRSTIMLEVVRKRFPETWGGKARNTQQTFERRNDPPPESEDANGKPIDPMAVSNRTGDELAERIQRLLERRKHDGSAK